MGSLLKYLDGIPSSYVFSARISSSMQSFFSVKSTDLNHADVQVKRPASPFAFFFQERSAGLKVENPEMKQKDIMRLASTMWKNCTNHEQQQYRDLFVQRMDEYKKSVKEPRKRPPTAYIQFFKEQNDTLRHQYPNVIERTKRMGELWRDLAPYQKDKYKDLYQTQLIDYLENLTEEDKQLLQNRREELRMRRERQKIRRYGKEAWKERPKIQVANAYIEYIRSNMAAVPKDQNAFVYLSQAWRELSDDEKLKYKEMADNIAERQRLEVAEWQEKHDIQH